MPWLATRIHNTEEAEFSGIPSTELVSVDGAAKTEVVTIVLPEAENDSPKSTFKHATDTTITVQEVNKTEVEGAVVVSSIEDTPEKTEDAAI